MPVRRAVSCDLAEPRPCSPATCSLIRHRRSRADIEVFWPRDWRGQDWALLLACDAAGTGLGLRPVVPLLCLSLHLALAMLLNDLDAPPEARRQGLAEQLMHAARVHAKGQRRRGLQLENGA